MHYQTSLYWSTQKLLRELISSSVDHDNVASADYESGIATALSRACEIRENNTFFGEDPDGNEWTVELI